MAIQENKSYESETIGGLFSDCEKAERAVSDLKNNGFSNNQIGAARSNNEDIGMTVAEVEDRDSQFWNRMQGIFSSGEDLTAEYAHPRDFEGTLAHCGISGDQARYFTANIHSCGCLVTVNASPDRSLDAAAILEKNGADTGTGAANSGRTPAPNVGTGRRIHLLGHILKEHKKRIQDFMPREREKDRRIA
jgi:hypothetical protein